MTSNKGEPGDPSDPRGGEKVAKAAAGGNGGMVVAAVWEDQYPDLWGKAQRPNVVRVMAVKHF